MATFIYVDPRWVERLSKPPENGGLPHTPGTTMNLDLAEPMIHIMALPTDPTFKLPSDLPMEAVVGVTVKTDFFSPGVTQDGIYTPEKITAQVKRRTYGVDSHLGQAISISGETVESVKDFIDALFRGDLTPDEPWEAPELADADDSKTEVADS